MAFTITFTPKNMSAAQYDRVIKGLETAGAAAPSGRLFHTCYGPANALRVVDVWASMEQFEKFGATLMPLLAAEGIDIGTPDVQPQHNSLVGK